MYLFPGIAAGANVVPIPASVRAPAMTSEPWLPFTPAYSVNELAAAAPGDTVPYLTLVARANIPGLAISEPALIVCIAIGVISLFIIGFGIYTMWTQDERRTQRRPRYTRRAHVFVDVTPTTDLPLDGWSSRPPLRFEADHYPPLPSSLPSSLPSTEKRSDRFPVSRGHSRWHLDFCAESLTPLTPALSPLSEKYTRYNETFLPRTPQQLGDADDVTISTVNGEAGGSTWSIYPRDAASVVETLPGYTSRPLTADSRHRGLRIAVSNLTQEFPIALATMASRHRAMARERPPGYTPASSAGSGAEKHSPL